MLSYYNDNSLKQRFGYKKNFNRDSDIFNLYLNGKSISEISSEINLKYNEDLDYGNIKKIVTQMKKIRAMGGGKLLTSKTKIGRRNRGLADLF